MKELADRIVALGVGQKDGDSYWLDTIAEWLSADQFAHSWEVAGALMEKVTYKTRQTVSLSPGGAAQIATSATPTYGVSIERTDRSDPHAIILACVEALKGETP